MKTIRHFISMNLSVKKLKISLKLKIAMLFILLVLGMMITVTYIFTIRELNLRLEQVKVRMERLANNIATIRSVETEDWDVYQTYIDNQIRLNPDIVYIAIFDERNELKASSLNMDWIDIDTSHAMTRFEQIRIILRLEQRQITTESQKDLEAKSVNIIIGEKNLGTVKVGFSLVELNDEMRKNLARNSHIAAVFFVIAIIAAYLMSLKIVTPLNKLTNAMLKISQGNLKQELHIRSRDEIGEMAQTFNFMAKGLQEKEFIEKFNRELGFTVELKKITDLIIERITTGLNSKQGFLFLRNAQSNASQFALISSYPAIASGDFHCEKNSALCQYLLSATEPAPLTTFTQYPDFKRRMELLNDIDDNTHICPIIIKNEISGLLVLASNNRNIAYTEGEKSFLSTLINQGAFAIESALLYQELTEQERLKRELEIARNVQSSLLPQQNPHLPGLDICGVCLPATEIGGDYYDYFHINDRLLGIVIADVAGKGASAAFYMAVVKGIMLSLVSIYTSPKKLLSELNRRLYGTMDKKIFITMIYAVIDIKHRQLTFSRAGHNSLILKQAKDNKINCFTPHGIGIGLEKGDIFDEAISEQKIKFNRGDLFLFYTDGITEAMNANRIEFSEQRLLDILAQSNNSNSEQIQRQIISSIQNFSQGVPQHDDITMITIAVT